MARLLGSIVGKVDEVVSPLLSVAMVKDVLSTPNAVSQCPQSSMPLLGLLDKT